MGTTRRETQAAPGQRCEPAEKPPSRPPASWAAREARLRSAVRWLRPEVRPARRPATPGPPEARGTAAMEATATPRGESRGPGKGGPEGRAVTRPSASRGNSTPTQGTTAAPERRWEAAVTRQPRPPASRAGLEDRPRSAARPQPPEVQPARAEATGSLEPRAPQGRRPAAPGAPARRRTARSRACRSAPDPTQRPRTRRSTSSEGPLPFRSRARAGPRRLAHLYSW